MTRNADSDKCKFSGYGTKFDAVGSFTSSDGSGLSKYVIIFGADMSSSMHIANKKKDILILGKGQADGLYDAMLTVEKEYSINFTEQQKKFCLSLHYNGVNNYIFLNGVDIYKFKAKDSGTNTAPLCLGNVSKDFSVDDMKKMRLYIWLIMIVLMLMTFYMFINI